MEFDILGIGQGNILDAILNQCTTNGLKTARVTYSKKNTNSVLDQEKAQSKDYTEKLRQSMTRVAAQLIQTKALRKKGVEGSLKPNWQALVRTVQEDLRREGEYNYRQKHKALNSIQEEKEAIKEFNTNNIIFHDEHTVLADKERVTAKHIIIELAPEQREMNNASTITQFFERTVLPKHIIIIGEKRQAFELAGILNALDTQVQLLCEQEHPLEQFDRDGVELLLDACAKEGIDVKTGVRIKKIEKRCVTTENQKFETDCIVDARETQPDINRLNTEKIGIHTTKKNTHTPLFLTDEKHRTNKPHIFAVGLCAASMQSSASKESEEEQINTVLQELLLNKEQTKQKQIEKKNNKTQTEIPRILLTIPALASVGLTEEQAEQAKIPHDVYQGITTYWQSSRNSNLSESGYKIIVDSETKHVIGAHLCGHGAEETIHLFAIAIAMQWKKEALQNIPFANGSVMADISKMLRP